ncbi:MAG: Na+/H+ antiporter subunit E [Rhizobiaceae bacterium]|nr:Na+/H+ antiporter subunit E [Rhizobiaceae bacterium]
MVRILFGASGLVALWLLMSGLWDKPLILIFGAISIVLTMWITIRMDEADGEQLAFAIKPFATVKYVIWLLAEIAKSNLAVSKIILSGRMPERQKLFMVPVSCKSEIAQVMFANSITLTPGTITVETENDQFIVHALDFSDEDMDGLADMDARVAAVESSVQS